MHSRKFELVVSHRFFTAALAEVRLLLQHLSPIVKSIAIHCALRSIAAHLAYSSSFLLATVRWPFSDNYIVVVSIKFLSTPAPYTVPISCATIVEDILGVTCEIVCSRGDWSRVLTSVRLWYVERRRGRSLTSLQRMMAPLY